MCNRSFITREEFEEHGLGGVVSVTCRDVCAEGFGVDGIADAGNVSAGLVTLYLI